MKKKILLLSSLFLIYIGLSGIGSANSAVSTITVVAPLISPMPGELFTVNVTITGAPQLTQWIIDNITWNPAYIELETNSSASLIEGTFMKPYGTTVWFAKPTVSGRAPEVFVGYISGGPCPGGNGLLCQLKFRAKALGSSDIRLGAAWLLDGLTIVDTPNRVNATLNVTPEFPMSTLIPIFLITTTMTLIAVITLRKKRSLIKIP
jgi:hypothetical protein